MPCFRYRYAVFALPLCRVCVTAMPCLRYRYAVFALPLCRVCVIFVVFVYYVIIDVIIKVLEER
ncbi:hypothetical protein QE197_23610 (plasmid) [Arsenophonus nasoniae]|uniref:hypothetical protein n=1 Tax=Arsenophonus nasoniae TaxID=638 RepID=UPI0024683265|nr:hypothetical protein [Arsenophonus nasoniae]WGM13445.1 hypothetical protein QE197_23610 [Arsenophonus nasoniae]